MQLQTIPRVCRVIWQITGYMTGSPLYPQSNCFVGRMVQTVKNILKKCEEEGDDPFLGLFSYRTKPFSHQQKSPAELLNVRNPRLCTLPMSQRAITSEETSQVKENLNQRQDSQGYCYNQRAGTSLNGWSQDNKSGSLTATIMQAWQPGTVIKTAKELKSFLVRNKGTEAVYLPTKSQLKPCNTATTGRYLDMLPYKLIIN